MAEKPCNRLRERLDRMTHEELLAAMRATGEWERTHDAEFIARMYADDVHLEVREIFEEDYDGYVAAGQELLARHPELAED